MQNSSFSSLPTLKQLHVYMCCTQPRSLIPSLPPSQAVTTARRGRAGPHIWDKLNGAALSAALWLGRCGCEEWGGAGRGCEGAAGLGSAAGGVRANLATLLDL